MLAPQGAQGSVRLDWFSRAVPLIIGHRGASADAPENTLSAFGLAVAQGADGIEFDVQLSADGWPVVIHDSLVDRTTNGKGKVSDLTLAELQALTIDTEEKIPTLDEVFEAFGSQILYNVEVKDMSLRDCGLEAAIVDRIQAYHLENAVLISSFNPFSLKRMRRHLPKQIPLALLRDKGVAKYSYLLGDADADHPHHQLVHAGYMAWAKKRGYRVNVWTVDEPDEARRLVNLGVHGLITNKPAFLRSCLRGFVG